MIFNSISSIKQAKQRILVLFASIIVLLFFTHMGAGSPYSWGCTVVNYHCINFDGHAANGDAEKNETIVKFFYEPSEANFYKMENIDVPFYYFLTSGIIGLTRSYAFSHYVINVVFLFLLFVVFSNLLIEFKMSESQIILSGLTILSLPFFTHYIGQQMYYISEVSISFIVLIITIKMTSINYKNPWVFGFLGGILLINYEWYQYYFAIVIFLTFFYPIKNFKIFFIISGVIYCLWRYFLINFSSSGLNLISSHLFSEYIFPSWSKYFRNIPENFIFPFLVGHTGLIFAFKMFLSHIYWPLTFFTIFYLLKLKPDLKNHRFGYLALAISITYLSLMIFIVPLEWEQNPRRFIPIIFVFSMAITYIIHNLNKFKNGIRILIPLIIISFSLSCSDFIFRTPVVHSLQFAEFIKEGPKKIFDISEKKLNDQNMPNLPKNSALKTGYFPKAKYQAKFLNVFIFSQFFCFSLIFLLFYFLQKFELVKIKLTRIYTILYLMSLFIRFI